MQAEQQRLEAVTGQVAQAEQNLEDAKAEMCIRDSFQAAAAALSAGGRVK